LLLISDRAADNHDDMGTPAQQVYAHTRAVVDFHRDPEQQGRPLGVMLAGAGLAFVAAALCARLAYQIWYTKALDTDTGLYGVSMLFAFFVLGCYLFSLGFELYDQYRALRLTLIFAIFGIIGLAVMIAVLVSLAFVLKGTSIALTEQQERSIAGAAISFAGGTVGVDPRAGRRAEHVPGIPILTCKHCDRDFIAVPPNAVCPWCDTPYLGRGIAKGA
jgi:hypothetical protein